MKMIEAQHFIGTIIDVLRQRQGISQYRLAKDTGLSKTSILRIERFEQNPTAATLYVIAKYLNVRIGDIFNKLDK